MRRSKTWKWAVAGALIAACSGGTTTVGVDGNDPFEPSEGDPTPGDDGVIDNPFDVSAGPSGPDGPGPNGSTGSGSCVTCAQLLEGSMGSTICPDSAAAVQALAACLSAQCVSECSEGINTACLGCLSMNCPSEMSNCASN